MNEKDKTPTKAYKGFDKNLQCRGFQYEVGKSYKTGKAKLCESGFHACESPLDVWRFYPPTGGNRFCEVEQSGDTVSDGCKTASTKIEIGAEIGIPGLIKAHVEYTRRKAKSGEKAGGYRASLAAGDRASLAGGYGANLAAGDSASLAGGDWASLAAGDGANLAGGDGANLAAGYSASLAAGDRASLAGGESSLCAVRSGKARGGKNSVLVLTDWERRNGEKVPVCVKAIIIDGETYKPDTWYMLRGGEVVEAE